MAEMIHAIVTDDEVHAAEVLEIMLQQYCPDVVVDAVAASGDEAIQLIRSHKPDLVFMDIEMPHTNGFDVVSATKDCGYQLVFTTAYNEFAITAFRHAAVDYLMKPVDADELKDAVERVRMLLQKQNAPDPQVWMELLGQMQSKKIALPMGDMLRFFAPDEIVRCESDSNYTHFYLSNARKLTIAKTLKEVEESLYGFGFMRIHQSHLVNPVFIDGISRGDSGFVILKDQTRLPVSRNRKEEILSAIRKI